MNPLHATIEEFATDGYTHVQCFCPRCRVIRLRPISWLPRISLGLTIAQLSERLRCMECRATGECLTATSGEAAVHDITTQDQSLFA